MGLIAGRVDETMTVLIKITAAGCYPVTIPPSNPCAGYKEFNLLETNEGVRRKIPF